MTHYVPLNKTDHMYAGWQKGDNLSFANQDMVVPLLVEELPHVLPTMPMAFTQQKTADGQIKYVLVALLSITPGHNFFLHPHGRWLGGYLPAAYRGYPFKLLQDQEGKHVVCFDTDSGLFRETPMPADEVFFTSDGELSETTRNIMTFMELCEKNRIITQRAVDSLQEVGIIQPWALKIAGEGDTQQPINGLYKIDESALQQLDQSLLHTLMQTGGLSIAYAQLFSQHRLSVFPKLHHLRQELLKQQSESSQVVDLEELFGEGNGDTLNFDFLK